VISYGVVGISLYTHTAELLFASCCRELIVHRYQQKVVRQTASQAKTRVHSGFGYT